jgi:hypothetical protein
MSLPFDLNRVRSMINEENLSTNARQFMNDLQHIQEQRRSKDNTSQLGHLMTMMKGWISLIASLKKDFFLFLFAGMQTSSSNTK